MWWRSGSASLDYLVRAQHYRWGYRNAFLDFGRLGCTEANAQIAEMLGDAARQSR
jgi:hypothetical protein